MNAPLKSAPWSVVSLLREPGEARARLAVQRLTGPIKPGLPLPETEYLRDASGEVATFERSEDAEASAMAGAVRTSAGHLVLQEAERAALERLIGHAKRDSGQSRRVADFLSLVERGSCGSYDLTTLWGLDDDIVTGTVTVFGFVARHNIYPDALGYEKEFEAIVREWRPELTES